MATPRTITAQINMAKSIVICDKTLRNKQLINTSEGEYYIINTETLLSKYLRQLKPYIAKYTLNGSDAVKYMYKPTFLSYDIYGTIELAPFILHINHMISASQFKDLDKGIYLFRSNINDMLNEIIIKEDKEIKLIKNNLEKDILSV